MSDNPDPFDRVDRAMAAFDERLAAETDQAGAEWAAEAHFIDVVWPKVRDVAASAMEAVATRLREGGHEARVVEGETPAEGVTIWLTPRTFDIATMPARSTVLAHKVKREVEMINEHVGGTKMGGGHFNADQATALTREQLLDKLGSWVGGALNPA